MAPRYRLGDTGTGTKRLLMCAGSGPAPRPFTGEAADPCCEEVGPPPCGPCFDAHPSAALLLEPDGLRVAFTGNYACQYTDTVTGVSYSFTGALTAPLNGASYNTSDLPPGSPPSNECFAAALAENQAALWTVAPGSTGALPTGYNNPSANLLVRARAELPGSSGGGFAPPKSVIQLTVQHAALTNLNFDILHFCGSSPFLSVSVNLGAATPLGAVTTTGYVTGWTGSVPTSGHIRVAGTWRRSVVGRVETYVLDVDLDWTLQGIIIPIVDCPGPSDVDEACCAQLPFGTWRNCAAKSGVPPEWVSASLFYRRRSTPSGPGPVIVVQTFSGTISGLFASDCSSVQANGSVQYTRTENGVLTTSSSVSASALFRAQQFGSPIGLMSWSINSLGISGNVESTGSGPINPQVSPNIGLTDPDTISATFAGSCGSISGSITADKVVVESGTTHEEEWKFGLSTSWGASCNALQNQAQGRSGMRSTRSLMEGMLV